MANYAGRQVQYGFAKEDTRGTAPTAADVWMARVDGNIDNVVEKETVEVSRGLMTKNFVTKKLRERSGGSFTGLVDNTDIGFILNGVFGDAPTPDDTPQAGTVYDHAFVPLQTSAIHQSLSVFKKTPSETKSYTEVMIDTFSMTFSRDEIPRFSMDVMGRKGATDTDTAAFTANNHFAPGNFKFFIENDVSNFSGATAVPIREGTITVAKTLVVEYDQGVPNLIYPTTFDVSGSITLLHDASTYHDLAFADTEKALRFQYIDTNTTIGTSSNPQITWDIYQAEFLDWEVDQSLTDLASQTLNFVSVYDIGNSADTRCTLRNLRSTAYDA